METTQTIKVQYHALYIRLLTTVVLVHQIQL
jgi:hypothetical protein